MPITKPHASPDIVNALIDGLPAYLSGPNYGSAGNIVRQVSIGSPPPIPSPDAIHFPVSGGPDLAVPPLNPIQTFLLGVGDVMNGSGLTAAKPAGWRFFVGQTESQMVLAWVSQRPAGAWKMASAFYGTGVTAAFNATNQLTQFEGSSVNYELNFLSMPSINLEAYLLKAADGSGDWVVPFPNLTSQLIPGLNTKASYTEAEFLAAIRAYAPRVKSTHQHHGG